MREGGYGRGEWFGDVVVDLRFVYVGVCEYGFV